VKILLVHNFYQQPGGEDEVFRSERDLLRAHGHEVHEFTLHNDAVPTYGKLALASATLWNREAHRAVGRIARLHRAEVVHFHNTFPLVSPAAYYAARDVGAAVVQTLHNFRLLCPGATFFRDGRPCEDCLGSAVPWRGALHGCYRGSRAQTGVLAAVLAAHRAARTWQRAVDRYVALTQFARGKFVAGGLPPERVLVKPNFLPDPGVGRGAGGHGVFVGRLSPEKGVRTLLDAWPRAASLLPLKIVGDGPLEAEVARFAATTPGVEWLGRQPHARVLELIGDASFLLLPSGCYEGFPRTIVEAFAKGTPVLASDLGAMRELVSQGVTGRRFNSSNPEDLALQVKALLTNSEGARELRSNARAEYERLYTPAKNHEMLLRVYAQAIDHARRRRHRAA
jgi:glycosyltransferase involved in cell wall biosynthesis